MGLWMFVSGVITRVIIDAFGKEVRVCLCTRHIDIFPTRETYKTIEPNSGLIF